VITLNSGQKIVVRESPEEIVDLVVSFRRQVSAGCEHLAARRPGAGAETDGRE
jgi:uncharacterized protein YlzI (FlbEa/FlbD family)